VGYILWLLVSDEPRLDRVFTNRNSPNTFFILFSRLSAGEKEKKKVKFQLT
jgi:hypothetical protein